MGSVRTVKQARALPEVSNTRYVEFREVRSDGLTVMHTEYCKLSTHPISGDDIMMFMDADGRLMQVDYLDDGPVKTPFRL